MSTKADHPPDDGKVYMLERNYLASARLNLQHFLWKTSFNFTIHPSISPSLSSHASIADIGTGTGIWLFDASRDLPSAHLTGYDVDLSQAPHSSWLPPNTSLQQWNIFDDPPKEAVGKYDLVHVRAMVLVVNRDTVRPFLRKVLKMLKPGGYIQWEDADVMAKHVKYPRSDGVESAGTPAAPALEALAAQTRALAQQDWLYSLPELLREEEFVEVSLTKYGDPDYLVRAFNDVNMLVVEEFARKMEGLGKSEEARGLSERVVQASREAEGGPGLSTPRVCCVGRKA